MSQVIQNVNLFQPQFHPKKEPLPFSQWLFVLLFVIATFGGLSWLKLTQIEKIEQQVLSLDDQHQTLMTQLSNVAMSNNASKKKAVKESEIADKEKDLKARRELVSTLSGGKYGSTDGFSDYLSALARQRVEGTWITGLSVQKGGDQLAIAGSSLKPELAPIYLQNLSNEKAFSGKTFSVLELNRLEIATENEALSETEKIDFIFRTSNDDVTEVEEIKNDS